MPEYNSAAVAKLKRIDVAIDSFITAGEANIDQETVASFGNEWEKFNDFKSLDLDTIGKDYFDLIDLDKTSDWVALDVGCGSGRWAKYLSGHVKFIEAIDPSDAVFVAGTMLQKADNVRVTHAGVDNIPFADAEFDLVYSLGVLHHVPDTLSAIRKCCAKIKKGGTLLLYLYYNLDNRGPAYRTLFQISNLMRSAICKLPAAPKRFVCDVIAATVYWPLVQTSKLVALASSRYSEKIPLAYYKRTSFHIMRNDALDRFGTSLEKRFRKKEIEQMLIECKLSAITFSPHEPFWHVVARKN